MKLSAFHRLLRVHAMQARHLALEIIAMLAEETGVEHTSPIYVAFYRTHTHADFIKIDWRSLASDIEKLASAKIPGGPDELLQPARLCADRAVLHWLLFSNKSGTTLKLLGMYNLSSPIAKNMAPVQATMEQLLVQADESLSDGRVCLQRFAQMAPKQDSLSELSVLLIEADRCYTAYRQAIALASECHEHLLANLSDAPIQLFPVIPSSATWKNRKVS